MSDDFLRLVSQANPAARQYQPASNGYPPSASSSAGPFNSPNDGQLMDPFFDDDDDNLPDSAFGRSIPMQSQESGLPLAQSAQAPAGHSRVTLGDGVPQGWNFDDDDLQPNSKPFAGSSTFNGPGPSEKPKGPTKKRIKWEWPWKREKVYVGERIIALNNRDANSEFDSNSVSTSKYNAATFLPKFLFGALSCSFSPVLMLTCLRAIL
jgi:phospholipid-transporting ATPase